jgi:hypothetical protein
LKPAIDGHVFRQAFIGQEQKHLVFSACITGQNIYPYTNIIARDVASSNLNTTPLPFPTSFRYVTAFDTVHLAHSTNCTITRRVTNDCVWPSRAGIKGDGGLCLVFSTRALDMTKA